MNKARDKIYVLVVLSLWLPAFVQAQSNCALTITANGPLAICEGGQVTLKANYPRTTTFTWYKDEVLIDGATSDLLVAREPGVYAVKAIDADCNAAPRSNAVTVTLLSASITADFSISADTVCSGSSVTFKNLSTGPNLKYEWDFGDLGSGPLNLSSSKSPEHTFTSVGGEVKVYTVTLKATSSNGCVVTVQKNLWVKQEPEAALIDPVSNFDNCAQVNTGGSSFTVNVSDISSTKETNDHYRILWGDNSPDFVSSSTFEKVTHTYAQEGVYTLTVIVTGKNGCQTQKEYTIKNIGRPQGLELRTTTGPEAGCGPLTVTYALNSPVNAPSTVYTIDFGDGSPLVSLPHPLPASITHVYDSASCAVPGKRFVINTTATNACKTTVITVAGPQVYKAPIPQLKIDKVIGCVNQPFSFQNLTLPGSSQDCASAVSYLWDFGDGTQIGPVTKADGIGETQTHTYKKAGTYKVKLTAQNGCASAFVEQEICVLATEAASFTIERARSVSCSSDTIKLQPSLAGAGSCQQTSNYSWDVQPTAGVKFINGTSNSSQNPELSFSSPGEYVITLSMKSDCGTETSSKSLTILDKPAVAFAQQKVEYCSPQTVQFGKGGTDHALSVLPAGTTVSAYNWVLYNGAQFATGSSANSAAPEVVFPQKGEYKVEMTVSGVCGPSAKATQVISIFDGTQALAIKGDTVICEGEKASLQVANSAGVCKWYTTASGGAAVATGALFTTPALTQSVTYYVEEESANGCVSDSRKAVRVQVYPANPNNKVTSNLQVQCAGETPSLLTGSNPETADLSYTYLWQMSEDGVNFVEAAGANTSQDYQTPVLDKDTWFRRVVSGGGCSEAVSEAFKITLVQKPAAPTVADKVICSGEDVLLQVTSPSVQKTYKWYTHQTGGAEIGVGATLSVTTLQADTAFYVEAFVEGTPCGSGTRTKASVTVLPALENNAITTSDQAICPDTSLPPFIGTTPTGGDGSYAYQWEMSTDSTTYEKAPNAATGRDYVPPLLNETTWFRRIAISGPCASSTSAPIKITVSPPIANNGIGTGQVVCEGQAPTMIWGTAPTGGNGKYTFQWEISDLGPRGGFMPAPGNNTEQSYQPTKTDGTRWYRRIVTSAPCQQQASAPVEVRAQPLPQLPDLSHLNQKICVGEACTLQLENTDWEYRWYSQPQGGTILHTGASFTTPTLQQKTVYYVEAVAEGGCASPARIPIAVEVATPAVEAGPDVTILQGRGAHVKATANTAGGGQYQWSPAIGLQSPNEAETLATPETTTTYTVTYTSPEGCRTTDQVTVEVLPAPFIPNVITQNNDNMNDVWDIKNLEYYPDCKVQVFNQWGSLIFSSTGYNNKWDGTYNGKPLPVSAYYYIIHLNDHERPITGSVTLIK